MGAKSNIYTIRYDTNILERLDDLCKSYGLNRSEMTRMAIWEMPTKEEKFDFEKKTEELENNLHAITEEHVRLRTFILSMANYIKKLERDNGARENSYIEQMVKEYPVLYQYACEIISMN